MAVGGGGDGVEGDAKGVTAMEGERGRRGKGGGHSLRTDMVTKHHGLIL